MKLENFEKIVEAKQEIKYIKFNDVFTIYKITTILGDNVTNRTGICLNTQVDELLKHPETFTSNETKGYYLFTKSTPEIFRTDVHSFHNNFNKYNVNINELFAIIDSLTDFDNFLILKYDTMKEILLEHNSELPLPKSMYFDYINGFLDNEVYDLEKVLSVLKTRDDVQIRTDRMCREIQDVPYYNQNEHGYRKFIDFIWQPKKEDWDKIAHKMTDYNRCEIILKEIFGFTKLPYEE